MSNSKNILIILTGSIACYKTCTVISRLKQLGHQIKVVMSPASLEFIGKSTIEGLTGEAPLIGLYDSGHAMDHIHLMRWADLVLVAPATANYINKIAHGIGDDLLTTLFLAHDFNKAFLLAPAMNTKMYLHPVTQESIGKLKKMNVEILETASGVLACGEIGSGRLLEPELIVAEVLSRLNLAASPGFSPPAKTKNLKVLITAGGTSEPIDDVRVITNKSTGRTAAFIADSLIESGLDVSFVHATSSALPKLLCERTEFYSFTDLQSLLQKKLKENHFDVVIHAAAVSDYSVIPQTGKISSGEEQLVLTLKRNPKLISQIKKLSPATKLIGFKLTSTPDESQIATRVKALFDNSDCDLVVQNDWSNVSRSHYKYRLYSRQDHQSIDGLPALASSLFQQIINSQEAK